MEARACALVPALRSPAPQAGALTAPPKVAALTARELEVLRLISTGRTSVQISAALGISRRTIENHKRRIFQKLGVQSQAHAVASAARLGLLGRAANGEAGRHGASRSSRLLLLGRPGPACDHLARLLGLGSARPLGRAAVGGPAEPLAGGRARPLAGHPAGASPPPRALVAVLADPDPDDWQAAADLGARVVLVLSGEVEQAHVVDALLRGADAVVPVAKVAQQLATAVALVGDGHTLVDPVQARALVDAARVQLASRATGRLDLTPREREILASIDRGESVKQTARSLGIATKTVENLQGRLFRKLGVRNRAQAVGAAHARGLLPTPSGT
jgi:two-component system, NarL family, nitrate/nitrite response regulator NarL